ncbi:MAG: flagellar basal-body MS-ring/collar protein FliF [Woeseiaceae bacterium]
MEGTVTNAELPAPVPQVQLSNVLAIPAVRQLSLLVGIAASIALGFWLVLWSQEPEYTTVFPGLEESDAAAVVSALQTSGIEYRVDQKTGGIMVLSSRVSDARMQLASQGLPLSAAQGMEMVGDQSSFGVSQFMETARYQHALEAELSRTIKSLRAIQDARVHLAIPKQSAFIRDQQLPSASVMLQLYGGKQLESGQASAIVNLVAGSIPGMLAGDVNVIDQFGRMLSGNDENSRDAMSANQFKMKRNLEQDYRQRIEQLLAPTLGLGNVRAEVVADLDFTVVEQTRESFDPNRTAIKSEQVSEEERKVGDGLAAGVPGALSNTPPQAGGTVNPESVNAAETLNSSRRSTRNFEVDKTISRTRSPGVTTTRLSVAVLIDEAAFNAQVIDADPADADAPDIPVATTTVLTMAQIEALVQKAVGFDAARGDTVEVVSAPFRALPELEAMDAPSFWEQPAFREILKQGIGVVLALVLGFGIVRPMLKRVVTPAATAGMPNLLASGNAPLAAVGGALEAPPSQSASLSYQDKVDAARNITGHDPARVAQVVRKWIDTDAS